MLRIIMKQPAAAHVSVARLAISIPKDNDMNNLDLTDKINRNTHYCAR